PSPLAIGVTINRAACSSNVAVLDGLREHYGREGRKNARYERRRDQRHNCPLKGSIQQLTETDAQTHSQTLGRALGVLWKSWGKD
ncbi:mCG145970, partial [Mus musculus]